MRSHTGEKPYSCTFPGCERKFSRSSDLRLHGMLFVFDNFRECMLWYADRVSERIHKGDKPFICDCEGCKKRFVRYADLKKHKRTHEGRIMPLEVCLTLFFSARGTSSTSAWGWVWAYRHCSRRSH